LAFSGLLNNEQKNDVHLRNDSILQQPKVQSPIEIINSTFLGNDSRNYYGNYCGDSLLLQWKCFLGSGKTIVTAEAGVEVWAGAGWTGQPLITREYGKTYIYQGCFDHHLKKLSLDSGELIWQYEFDDILKGTGTLVLNEDAIDTNNRLMIYQGSRKGLQYSLSDTNVSSFRAISCITGKEQWRMPMKHTRCYSSDVDASPLFVNGVGYIGLENGYFVSFDPQRSEMWTDTFRRPMILSSDLLYNEKDVAGHGGNLVTEASPVRLGNHLYIASGCGHIFGYNLDTKQIDWDYEIFSDIDGTPVVTADQCLLIAIEKQYIAGHGGVMKINPSRAPATCVDWYYPTRDRNFSSWIGGVIGSVSVNDVYRKPKDPYLAAFTGIDGILTVVDYMNLSGTTALGPDGKTMYPVPSVYFTSDIGPSISTPMFTMGHIVAAGYNGIRIFKTDSAVKYVQTAFQPGMFEASPVCHNGKVIIASRDGYLYCYGSGELQTKDIDLQPVVPQHPDFALQPVILPAGNNVKSSDSVKPIVEKAPKRIDTIVKTMLAIERRAVYASKEYGKSSIASVTPSPKVSTGSYLLIVGVFKSEENATNYQRKWVKRGYSAEIIVQPNGMHYVSLMRGETEEQLKSEIVKLDWGKEARGWVWSPQE